MSPMLLVALCYCVAGSGRGSFVAGFSTISIHRPTRTGAALRSSISPEDLTFSVPGTATESDYDTLHRTIETKQMHPDVVIASMLRMEKQSHKARKVQSQTTANAMAKHLEGDWRPVFSSGTKVTQARLGGNRLNYFPMKAVISFKPEEGKIQNGLFIGDYCLIRVNGTCEYQPESRRFRFGFHQIKFMNGAFQFELKEGEDVQFAQAAGLGGKVGLWNILLADGDMMMARGEAISLWEREQGHEAEW